MKIVGLGRISVLGAARSRLAMELSRPSTCLIRSANSVSGTLHVAQAQSNRGAGGRKRDFPDAERFGEGLATQELTLSLVPDAEQRSGGP
jgi:hypothetical protein